MLFFKPNPEKLARKKDVVGLLRLLASREGELRHSAKYYLRQDNLKPTVIPHLIRALSDPSVSADAAALLGDHQAHEAVDNLVSALKSTDQETRRQAAGALSKMYSHEVRYRNIQPLVDAALGPEPDIRRDAIRAIYYCADPRAFDAFCANLSDSEVGWYAAIGLRELGDPRAVGPLTQALADSNARLREWAGSALTKIGNDGALAALLNYARSVDKPSTEILANIASFEMEPATDFLIGQGHWHRLWPKHKLLVFRSEDRCRRVGEFIAKSISVERYSRVEHYEFLAAIVREQGAAVDQQTLMMVVGLQPPKAGWADEGYEAEQAVDDHAREQAHKRLIETANTELHRRRL